MTTHSIPAALVVACVACVACIPGTVKPRPPVQPSRVFNMPERALCDATIRAPEEVGTVDNALLTEASGIVASPSHKGVLWMHNDSGDGTARVFAVSTTGKDLGQETLPNIQNIDFEDIAAAPCPDLAGPCLYLADTGDNALNRPSMNVYALPEPDVDVDRPLPANSEAPMVWRFPITAPDGPINLEAMVVLPDDSAMVFYEKAATGARILKYAAPWTPEALATLEVTATFNPPAAGLERDTLPTGADIHPSGTRLVLRTYGAAFEVHLDAANGVTADHFGAGDLVKLFDGPASEPQGEAIAYDEDGTGLFLVSESPDHTPHQPLHHAACN